MTKPPKSWIVEQYVRDGQVTFCTRCRVVPAIPTAGGHDCHKLGLEAHVAGLLAPLATESADPDRLDVEADEDRPGFWRAVYAAA